MMLRTLSRYIHAAVVAAGLAMGIMACDVKDDDHPIEEADAGNVEPDAGTPDAAPAVATIDTFTATPASCASAPCNSTLSWTTSNFSGVCHGDWIAANVDLAVDGDYGVTTSMTRNYVLTCGTLTRSTSITVGTPAVDHTPLAQNDTASTAFNTAIEIDVLANDTGKEDAPLTLTLTDPPHGVVSVTASNKVLYTPDTGYSGPDSFTYMVRDADGDTSSATVAMTVNNAQVIVACTTNAQCNQAAPLPVFPAIQGVCVPATPQTPQHCEWHTEECDQTHGVPGSGSVYITPWGTHGPAPDVEMPTVAANPGTLQYMGYRACSARAFDAQWGVKPICGHFHMWKLSTRRPFMDTMERWILGQSHPTTDCFISITHDAQNMVRYVPLARMTIKERVLEMATRPAGRVVVFPSEAEMERQKAVAIQALIASEAMAPN